MKLSLAVEEESQLALPEDPRWVGFRCEGRGFAAALEQVREIVESVPFTRIPGCGREVCGLAGVRGRVVTVFDFGVVLGLRPALARCDHRVLLVEHAQRFVGMVVDEVVAVTRAAAEASGGTDGLDIDADETVGTCRIGGQPHLVLNLDRIFARLLDGRGMERDARE